MHWAVAMSATRSASSVTAHITSFQTTHCVYARVTLRNNAWRLTASAMSRLIRVAISPVIVNKQSVKHITNVSPAVPRRHLVSLLTHKAGQPQRCHPHTAPSRTWAPSVVLCSASPPWRPSQLGSRGHLRKNYVWLDNNADLWSHVVKWVVLTLEKDMKVALSTW